MGIFLVYICITERRYGQLLVFVNRITGVISIFFQWQLLSTITEITYNHRWASPFSPFETDNFRLFLSQQMTNDKLPFA
jgi:hypothetical protein